jgi:hypothetical protein
VLPVFFAGIREDKDVVNIGCAKYVKERAEDFVNLCLKGGRGIRKAKGHDKCFKKAIASVKCRYLFMAFLDLYMVKGVNNVELGVELGFAKLRQCFLKQGKGVLVLDYDCV